MSELTHIDKSGNPQMVDVNKKADTERTAKAEAIFYVGSKIMEKLLRDNFNSKKGAVLQTAIIAGNMAVKKTSDLIPLCHPISINACSINIEQADKERFRIVCEVKTKGKTGVEMEALNGVTISALTMYDMLKSFSKSMEIANIKLLTKTGGKSDFKQS